MHASYPFSFSCTPLPSESLANLADCVNPIFRRGLFRNSSDGDAIQLTPSQTSGHQSPTIPLQTMRLIYFRKSSNVGNPSTRAVAFSVA